MDAQTIVALAIVAACGGYVAWRYLRMIVKPESAGCHCARCPVAKEQVCHTACPSTEEPTNARKAREVEV
jgi:hypothetical protein